MVVYTCSWFSTCENFVYWFQVLLTRAKRARNNSDASSLKLHLIISLFLLMIPFSDLHVWVMRVRQDGLGVGVCTGGPRGRHRGRHAPEVAGLGRGWRQHWVWAGGGGAGLHHTDTHRSTLKLRANHRNTLHCTTIRPLQTGGFQPVTWQ